MGLRGRKTQSLEVLKAKGTYRKARHMKLETKMQGIALTNDQKITPTSLNEIGQAEWQRIMNANEGLDNYLSVLDLPMLEIHCILLQEVMMHYQLMKELSATKDVKATKHKKFFDEYYRQYRQSCLEFGLTPLSRAKLPISAKQIKEVDKYANFH